MCMSNKLGNPICRCLAGLVPKPDTITGCGPECTVRIYPVFRIQNSGLGMAFSNTFCDREQKLLMVFFDCYHFQFF